jgi:hypothetical protein
VQDIIERSWETSNMMDDEEEKESIMAVEEKQVEEITM